MRNNDLRNEFESEQTNEKFSLGSEILEYEILLEQGLLENDIEKIAIMQKVEKKAEKYRKKRRNQEKKRTKY